MSYTYDIKTSKNDKRSTICLSVCHLMYAIINLFISTFLIAHMYSLTTDLFSYALTVGLFQLSTYITMLIGYYVFSFIVDKTNRIWVYRVANFLEAVLVIVTIFYGKDLAKLVLLAGFLNGLLHTTYYASYNVLKQEMVSRKSMGKYVVTVNILNKIISVICPILLGALIDISTFSMVAIYVLIISIIQTIISFFIKAKRPKESNFNVRQYLKKLKENPENFKQVKSIYLMSIPYAFRTITTSLLSVNIMMHFGSNFSLGLLTSVFALVSIVVLILFNKFTKAGKRSWVFYVITALQILGSVVFAIFPNLVTLLLYNFGMAVCDVVMITMMDIYRNKNLKENGLYDDIAEHQCIVETIYQIIRVLSFALLVLLGLIKSYLLFQIFFVVFMVVSAITTIMLMVYEKKNTVENKEEIK